MAPSVNSTNEWMMLSGWTTTAMSPAGTLKSQRASAISSPLFIIVAESMVILRPMAHFGCRRASATVTRSKSTSGRWAKGPPEAVSTSRRMRASARRSGTAPAGRTQNGS